MGKNKNKSNNGGNGKNDHGKSHGGGRNGIQGAVNNPSFPKIQNAGAAITATLGENEAPFPITAPEPKPEVLDGAQRKIISDYLEDLERYVREVADETNKCKAARNKLESLQKDVQSEKTGLESLRQDLEAKQIGLKEQEDSFQAEKNSLEDLARDSRNGFIKQQGKWREELKGELVDLEKSRDSLIRDLDRMQQEARDERNRERDVHRAELSARVQEMDAKEMKLATLQAELERKRNRLDLEWSELEKEKQEAREEALADVLGSLERSQSAHQKTQERLEKAYRELSERETEIAEFHEFQRVLGTRSPDELLQEHSQLTREIRDLKRQLAGAGDMDFASQIEGLRLERDALREKSRDLETELNISLAELRTTRVSVLDKERLESEKRVLVQHKQLLTSHINDLERSIDSLTKAQRAERVFPQLSRMDEEKSYQEKAIVEEVPNLERFAIELQHSIAGVHDIPLYYQMDDIRLFLGGLAMSQLHILQGMSGTGKTSIVKAFSRAVGGFCSDIAVQAGWRDKYDLVGHFNAFEKKFYEEECLQALYRAQVPQYKDRINVVLLDEMNLSRPEQYFAEFLSALEKNDIKDRLVKLLDSAPTGAPSLLNAGRKILVPENVWFIGTANHDESTNEFADKTRDRSHVMELKKCDPFPFARPDRNVIYSYGSLRKKFREARKNHENQTNSLLHDLMAPKGNLTKVLGNTYDIAWGNRFAEHARSFIPVVIAAGGSWELGLDHLLATRVFRAGKVTGRYDITTSDLKAVEDALLAYWPKGGDIPVKCLELIERDRKRKERGA